MLTDEATAEEVASMAQHARETQLVETDLFTWMVVHGNLQLALRHPNNRGSSRVILEKFVLEIGQMLVQRGMLTQERLDYASDVERSCEVKG